MVEGADSTAKLDGYWEGSQFAQVCNGFEFEGIGLCDDFEGELLARCCRASCACSSSVAANHRQVAIAHPRLNRDKTHLDDTYNNDNNNNNNNNNNNSAEQPLKQPHFPLF